MRVGQPTETGHLLMAMFYALHEGFIHPTLHLNVEVTSSSEVVTRAH